jgi:hypothetical protein
MSAASLRNTTSTAKFDLLRLQILHSYRRFPFSERETEVCEYGAAGFIPFGDCGGGVPAFKLSLPRWLELRSPAEEPALDSDLRAPSSSSSR